MSSALAPAVVGSGTATPSRPVMLLTLDTVFDPEAVRFAIDAAADAGAELLVCDGVPLAAGQPASNAARSFGDRDALDGCSRAAAEARARGVKVVELLFHHPRPVTAAVRVCEQRGVGLLVFGPDRRRMGRFGFHRAARRIRKTAPCLIWVAGEGR